MTVKQLIKKLKEMNPEQTVVIAIDGHATQYLDVNSIAQPTKYVVIEIEID
jgi:TusA-related sulfurtransferase